MGREVEARMIWMELVKAVQADREREIARRGRVAQARGPRVRINRRRPG